MKIVETTYKQRYNTLVELACGNASIVNEALKQVNVVDPLILEPTVEQVVKYIKQRTCKNYK